MKEFSKYVGLDTHKDTIAVAVAGAMGGQARYFGEIANTLYYQADSECPTDS